MMRFSFFDHHHHQEDLHASSSLTSATAAPPPPPAFLGLASSNHDSWNQNLLLTTATQEVGFQWPDNAEEGHLPSPSVSITDHHHQIINKGRRRLHDDHSFSPGTGGAAAANDLSSDREGPHMSAAAATTFLQDPSSMVGFEGSSRGGDFSVVVSPTETTASSEYLICSPQNLSPFSGSFGMDLQQMSFLSSANWLGRSFYQASANDHLPAALLGNTASYEPLHLPEPDQGPSYYHHKMPSLVSGATTEAAMRGGNSIEERNIKPSQAAAASNKRPRFEQHQQRSSLISPFKVRKEKLGDRIAALQQLVAPFGKTDTASVLMEAFGYIKFLQDQIETLSVPYMRSSGSKATGEAGRGEDDKVGAKLDLRSRGLCLVPLACTSYMTSDHGGGGGGGGWSPPDHYQGFG